MGPALVGLLLGAAVVCHPTYLLAAGALAGWMFFRDRLRAVLIVAGLAAALAPTTMENLKDFGKPTLVSHNSGINLYLGNNALKRVIHTIWLLMQFTFNV